MLIMDLLNINDDCLLNVFSFCHKKDILNLCQTSKALNYFNQKYILSKLTRDILMCGHRGNPAIMERTNTVLTHGNRFHISRNWTSGRYSEKIYFNESRFAPTKLHLEKNALYVSNDCNLRRHKRFKDQAFDSKYEHVEFSSEGERTIHDFVKKSNIIFGSYGRGCLFILENDELCFEQSDNLGDTFEAVDFAGHTYTSSTKDSCNIYQRKQGADGISLDLVKHLKPYGLTRLNKTGDRLFGAKKSSLHEYALAEVDLQSGEEYMFNCSTVFPYDMKVKDDSTLFTVNLDGTFRIYDRRSDCENIMFDNPFISLHNLEYDGLYAALCSSRYDGNVYLFDIRKPGIVMQMYSLIVPDRTINSMACDSRYLFLATNTGLHVLDFKDF